MATRRRGRAQGSGLPNLAQMNEKVNNVIDRMDAMDARAENMTKTLETILATLNDLTRQQPEVTISQSETQAEDSLDRNVGGQNENVDEDYLKYLDRFQRMNPKRFKGTSDPDKAEEWALLMDKYFDVLRCPEVYKVSLAAMTLEGEAEHWWRALKRRVTSIHQQLSWGYFINAFYDKYFSRAVRIRKATEFDALQQGNMSVDEYEAAFSALIRFVPQVEADNLLKATKFRDGLRYRIRKAILGEHDYFGIVQKAQEAERDLLREETEKTKVSKGSRGSQRSHSQKRTAFSQDYGKRRREESNAKPAPTAEATRCIYCGYFHGNQPCQKRLRLCYNCGQSGHFMADCPRGLQQQKTTQVSNVRAPMKPSPTAAQPGVQGRVYQLKKEGAIHSPDVASGM